MEIKEKEYIRYIPTNDWVVVIKKVTKIECRMLDNAYYLDDSKEEVYSSHFDDIIKHSKNIIELIEKDDIVMVDNIKYTVITFLKDGNDDIVLKGICKDGIYLTLGEIKIQSILTKQQFESNAYVLEKER